MSAKGRQQVGDKCPSCEPGRVRQDPDGFLSCSNCTWNSEEDGPGRKQTHAPGDPNCVQHDPATVYTRALHRCRLCRVQHNHVTRDIKPQGACPACDQYYQGKR